MDKLLMIADDLTGALDAGVAFASAGIQTCVGQGDYFLRNQEARQYSVQVTVAETRHVSAQDAYDQVYELVQRAAGCGFTCIYKKTDSALRGNPGAELAAVRDASEEKTICFVPAFPKMNRVTRQGVQYIDGTIPVAESVFGNDPFNPVRYSAVLEIISQTTEGRAYLADPSENVYDSGIAVFDAQTEADILRIARNLVKSGNARLLAGCAGLASVLPQVLQFPTDERNTHYPGGHLAVFCGSINPISMAQCQTAVDQGAPRFHLMEDGRFLPTEELAERIAHALQTASITVFDTGSLEVQGTDPKHIAERVSLVVKGVTERNTGSILFIIGGDTLIAFIRTMGIETIIPMAELFPGVVLAKYHDHGNWHFLISKSGGFGDETLLMDIYGKLNPKEEMREVRNGR